MTPQPPEFAQDPFWTTEHIVNGKTMTYAQLAFHAEAAASSHLNHQTPAEGGMAHIILHLLEELEKMNEDRRKPYGD